MNFNQLKNYALQGPYAGQKMQSNQINQAYANAYRAAQTAYAENTLRSDKLSTLREVDELEEALSDLQLAVQDERGTWNNIWSLVGCVGGGIVGASGGPAGAVAGCSLGSQLLSTGADFVYDSELMQTDLENQLQAKEQELRDYEVELDALSTKYPKMGGAEFEYQVEKGLTDDLEAYDLWEEGFYGKEGLDYAMDVVGIGLQWGATKVGGALLDKWFAGTPVAGDEFSFTDQTYVPTPGYEQYVAGSGDHTFQYELPTWETLLSEQYPIAVEAK